MKIITTVLSLLLLLFISCKENTKETAEANDSLSMPIIEEKTSPKINNTVTASDDVYDYYFQIDIQGVYKIDKDFNFELFLDEDVYLDRRYGNLLLFRHNSEWTYLMYDYLSNAHVNIPLNIIKQINFLPENKIEVIGHINYDDETLVMDYLHDYDGKSINIEADNENAWIYGSIGPPVFEKNEYSNNKNDDVYILEIFDKRTAFDITNIKPKPDKPRIELYYDKLHSVFFICAWSGGRE